MKNMNEKKVAILSEMGFEESELTSPKKALEDAGAQVQIVSPCEGKIRGWKDGNWSIEINVDKNVSEVTADDYDALVIPGGVINPDKMRRNADCISFAKAFMEAGKPIAAICHGPQLLIETGLLNGRKLTSFSSIRTDLENAGAKWVDMEVVVDNGLVTSRSPKDLQAFNKKMLEEIREGVHEEVAH